MSSAAPDGANTAHAARTVIVGAAGRMGQQLLSLIGEFPALKLQGAIDRVASAGLGQDVAQPAGGVPAGVAVSTDLAESLKSADLVIDFSHPEATAGNIAACVQAGVALLIGTTGLPPELEAAFAQAAQRIPLLVAANTSLGVNVLLELTRRAAQALPAGYDIEIVETHHRSKRDAPSGTALALGNAAAEGRRASLQEQAAYRGPGVGPSRATGQIGLASLRGGDVVGEHEVWFFGPGERVLLKHSATDRAVFARGALTAGAWLVGRSAGRYAMRNVFDN
jgi:4-hydroxy-tetrahydrodipicolinate reductase